MNGARSTLSPLQTRVLEVLAPIAPPWALTGGAALAGFHLGHRTTRDLDLFWHGASTLGTVRDDVETLLKRAGILVERIQSAESFHRLRVTDGEEAVLVDLVAEPTAPVEKPSEMAVGASRIRVDGMHEILVNTLCTLLSRAELRDLIDVRALLDAGGDFPRALADAPRKDGGFSPLTLAWLMRDLPLESMSTADGRSAESAKDLVAFRDRLVKRLLELSRPDDSRN